MEVEYNAEHAPARFLDQTTFDVVEPATPAGVEWTRRLQLALGRAPGDDDRYGETLAVDGMFGPRTQSAYTRRFGPLTMDRHTAQPMPCLISRWGYDHAHDDLTDDPDGQEWRQRDPYYERHTGERGWRGEMLRFVAGFDRSTRRFHRTPRSYVSLDKISIGLAHYVDDGAFDLIRECVALDPCRAVEAFGARLAGKIAANERSVRRLFYSRRTKQEHTFALSAIVAGWRHIAGDDDCTRLQADRWLRDKVAEGIVFARAQGWAQSLRTDHGGRVLALCTRLCNSGFGKGQRYVRRAREELHVDGSNALEVLEATYKIDRMQGGYGKPHRWRWVASSQHFRGPVPVDVLDAYG